MNGGAGGLNASGTKKDIGVSMGGTTVYYLLNFYPQESCHVAVPK